MAQMNAQLPYNRLRKMVKQLVEEHKNLGYEKLKLAVWFGEKDQVSDVHLLEIVENHPESLSGYLETYEFAPSKDFPVRLHLAIAAPGDLETALQNQDRTLQKARAFAPEVIFADNGEGEKLWKRIKDDVDTTFSVMSESEVQTSEVSTRELNGGDAKP